MMTMTWKEEIRNLADDFMIDSKAVDRIIKDVERLRIHDNNSNYHRAWKRLFDLM